MLFLKSIMFMQYLFRVFRHNHRSGDNFELNLYIHMRHSYIRFNLIVGNGC